MKIYSINDPKFKEYGQIITGFDLDELISTLDKSTPLPDAVDYVPEHKPIQDLAITKEVEDNIYGGMPVQMGWCNGHNTKLNCLEYHRDSEINLGTSDFILLLGKREEIDDNNMFDTSDIAAFYVPAGVMIEVYATTLHYAPCSAKAGEGFKVLVVLPKGTNTDKPNIVNKNYEDTLLFARNKWLLAHEEAGEVQAGAVVGLKGVNVDIADQI